MSVSSIATKGLMSTIRILARVLVFKLMLIALLLAAKPASAGTAVRTTPCYQQNWGGPIGIYCGTLQEAARTYMDDTELYVASIGLNYTYEVLEVYAGQHNLDIHFLRSDGFNNWTQVGAYCPPGYNNLQPYVCQRDGVDKKRMIVIPKRSSAIHVVREKETKRPLKLIIAAPG